MSVSVKGKTYNVKNGFLKLSGLGITNLSEIKWSGDLSTLKELWLSNNQITDIAMLGHLTNLESLNLNNNLIADIKGIVVIKDLPHLQYLSLDQNPIRIKHPDATALHRWKFLAKWEDTNAKPEVEKKTIKPKIVKKSKAAKQIARKARDEARRKDAEEENRLIEFINKWEKIPLITIAEYFFPLERGSYSDVERERRAREIKNSISEPQWRPLSPVSSRRVYDPGIIYNESEDDIKRKSHIRDAIAHIEKVLGNLIVQKKVRGALVRVGDNMIYFA